MAIYLPGTAEDQPLALDQMTPREIVLELDKYVVGQAAAKRAVAVALRNRTRRQKLPPELAEEIMPKNILMIGSTGVGKTEIARRLAKLTGSPFLKVEASKFTEVGYVGRDVESMVRDLVENAIDMVRDEKLDDIEDRAELAAEEKLIDLLAAQTMGPETGTGSPVAAAPVAVGGTATPSLVIVASHTAPAASHTDPAASHTEPAARHAAAARPPEALPPASSVPASPAAESPAAEASGHEPALALVPRSEAERAREKDRLRQQFREGKLDDRMVELDVRDRNMPQFEIVSSQAPEEIEQSGIKDMLPGIFGQRSRKRPMKVADAFEYLIQEEEGRLLDMDQVTRVAIERVEESGIVFLDEIDKIAGREGGHGPDISREGVQRDILPIVEGTTVNTKYGNVSTDHILFIAAGAFHVSKPSDLIPELQGRFPIRVELQALTEADFLRILTEPRASLVKQAVALLETEGLKLEFAPEALSEMAAFAFRVNEQTENIGARRLHTILEKVLDEISFHAPDMLKPAEGTLGTTLRDAKLPTVTEHTTDKGVVERVVTVDRAYVQQQVAEIVKNQDLSRYIL